MTVSLEVLGDTAIDSPDGTLIEESKSRTGRGNPISDRSRDFWKTLRNWIEAAQAGLLDAANTRFQLFVSRPSTGRIVQLFHNADSEHEALRALVAAYRILGLETRQSSGARPARIPSKIPAGLRDHLTVILRAPPQLVATIIRNFQLEVGSGQTIKDLRSTIDATLIPPEIAEDVLYHVAGWLKTRVDGQIERGVAACIHWEDFRTAVNTAVRLFDRRDVLKSLAREPSGIEVDKHLQFRTYVRQLRIVELDFEEQLRAVTDFIKAETDRTQWAEKGYVIEESFKEFQHTLMDSWRNYKRRCDIVNKNRSEPERGQLLYSDCCGHQAKLGGSEVPEHFCRGSFHKLADSPDIGWHPRYQKLLASVEADPSEGGQPSDVQALKRPSRANRRRGQQ
jgi:hypothetical protein